ncbi:hypothetical protein GCM10020229_37990 [Kitasatospora albolonga]
MANNEGRAPFISWSDAPWRNARPRAGLAELQVEQVSPPGRDLVTYDENGFYGHPGPHPGAPDPPWRRWS